MWYTIKNRIRKKKVGEHMNKEHSVTVAKIAELLDLKNLTDKQYEIVGAYPMPGRSFQFSLSYKL